MNASTLKQRIESDMKTAMKARDKERLQAIRLIMAAIKQREVDERIELTDNHVLEILGKMIKQRRESISQFTDAGRNDLVEIEQFEVSVINTYMPEPLSEEEVIAILEGLITETGASSMKDMGMVMSALKEKVQGRADMSQISKLVKEKLA